LVSAPTLAPAAASASGGATGAASGPPAPAVAPAAPGPVLRLVDNPNLREWLRAIRTPNYDGPPPIAAKLAAAMAAAAVAARTAGPNPHPIRPGPPPGASTTAAKGNRTTAAPAGGVPVGLSAAESVRSRLQMVKRSALITQYRAQKQPSQAQQPSASSVSSSSSVAFPPRVSTRQLLQWQGDANEPPATALHSLATPATSAAALHDGGGGAEDDDEAAAAEEEGSDVHAGDDEVLDDETDDALRAASSSSSSSPSSSLSSSSSGRLVPGCDVIVPHPVLFVRRRGKGRAASNLFHTTEDILQIWMSALLLADEYRAAHAHHHTHVPTGTSTGAGTGTGAGSGPSSSLDGSDGESPSSMMELEVVFVDAKEESPFIEFW
jgi:hypothetical protein